jgi:2-C-methyl-D-erythritol 4-phosphate cytidylyltransferase
MRKNIGIILAGGVGSRFGTSLPKQFMKVAGKMVIEHTIAEFQNSTYIDEIAIIVHENYRYIVEQMLVKNSWNKVKKILNGGKERYNSTLVAIEAYAHVLDVNLILHDAVRPLVNERILHDVVIALDEYEAVDVCVSATDTIVIGTNNANSEISGIPQRHLCYQGQTPQGFRLLSLKKAYEYALKDKNFQATDDCGVLLRYLPDLPIKIVKVIYRI